MYLCVYVYLYIYVHANIYLCICMYVVKCYNNVTFTWAFLAQMTQGFISLARVLGNGFILTQQWCDKQFVIGDCAYADRTSVTTTTTRRTYFVGSRHDIIYIFVYDRRALMCIATASSA